MFYVTQPDQYFRRTAATPAATISDLNELCLLNHLQRDYIYKQQQIEKRQIQKLNAPELEFKQDIQNYYILLTKNVTRSNYHYMNKFTSYSLKQAGDCLIIRSTKDNFYKNIALPKNADLERDITYESLNNGYRVIVTIPKQKIPNQIKSSTFGLPDFFGALNLLSDTCERTSAQERPEQARSCRKIKIPITDDSSDTQEVQISKSTKESENEVVSHPVPEKDDEMDTEAEKEATHTEPLDLLKNYKTTERKTTFIPNSVLESQAEGDQQLDSTESEVANDVSESEVSIPIERVLTPTLEDVVDAEFL